MAPSVKDLDRLAPCVCIDAELRAKFPEHSIRDHDLYNVGHGVGWQMARDSMLNSLLPDGPHNSELHERITEILG